MTPDRIPITLTVNGQHRCLKVRPDETLLDALRDAGCMGVKRGCEQGTCGSCVVLLDGLPHYSCLLFAAAQDGREVITIEALASVGVNAEPHPIIRAFAEEAGVQCGYCVPGMVLSAKALLDENPRPSEREVKQAIDGHLCRCTGYIKQIKAILRAADLLQATKEAGR